MKIQNNKAFTLVELIIVITILAILATIGFMSFQSYTIDARDSNRITSLKELSNGLQIYYTKKATFPNPDEQVTTISSGTSVISYQGYAGTSVSKSLRASDIKDPKENIPYTYTVNGDKIKYQLLALLENGTSIQSTSYNNILNDTYAANTYNDRYMYTVGDKLGIFLDNTTKAPVQETLTGINLQTNNTNFKVVFANTSSNSGVIVGSGISLATQILTISNTVATTQSTPVATPIKVQDVFATSLYTGNGTTQTINNGIDLAGQGGMVWIKNRSVANGARLTDTSRSIVSGSYQCLTSNGTHSLLSYGPAGITNFNSNGYALSGDGVGFNDNGNNMVSWTFRKAPKFFDIVTWTGDGTTNRQFSHNLGLTPGMIIIKSTTSTESWHVWHKGLGYSIGRGGNLGKNLYNNIILNEISAQTIDGNGLSGNYMSPPTTTTFNISGGLGAKGNNNTSGQTYVAYLFANDDSTDGIIKCGSFTTNSSGISSVTLGWEPQFLISKSANGTSNWWMHDITRGMTSSSTAYLSSNTANSEASSAHPYNNSTGFNVQRYNASQDYIYCAIRKGPM